MIYISNVSFSYIENDTVKEVSVVTSMAGKYALELPAPGVKQTIVVSTIAPFPWKGVQFNIHANEEVNINNFTVDADIAEHVDIDVHELTDGGFKFMFTDNNIVTDETAGEHPVLYFDVIQQNNVFDISIRYV